MILSRRRLDDARLMINSFTSVGVSLFTLFGINEENDIFLSRKFTDPDEIYLNLCPDLLLAEANSCSLHLRPYTLSGNLVQLDDLNISLLACDLAEPFLVTETSYKNYQLWLALDDKISLDEIKLVKKLYKADPGSTGSCRLGGSINFKAKHAPSFPTVRVVHSAKGVVASKSKLLEAADKAHHTDTERKNPLPGGHSAPRINLAPRAWPYYEKALEIAPKKHNGKGPDRSVADFNWCCMALKFGFHVDVVAEKLFAVSTKAQEKGNYLGEAYAIHTAYSACAHLEKCARVD